MFGDAMRDPVTTIVSRSRLSRGRCGSDRIGGGGQRRIGGVTPPFAGGAQVAGSTTWAIAGMARNVAPASRVVVRRRLREA
jgi:hypothetical protein